MIFARAPNPQIASGLSASGASFSARSIWYSLIAALTNGNNMMGGAPVGTIGTIGTVWVFDGHMVVATAISHDPEEIFNMLLTNLYNALPQYVTQYAGTTGRRQAAA